VVGLRLGIVKAPSLAGGTIAAAAPDDFIHSGPAAVVRTAVRFVLWATVLRALAHTVGVWAAGSLSVATTFAIAVLAPAWLFVLFPTWIAWRAPTRWRFRPLMLLSCWLSPLVRARDLRGIEIFLEVAADRSFPAPHLVPADAWTALAAALQAEGQGDPARADRIVDALAHLPDGARFPWLARVHGVEPLLTAALRRGDWLAVARRAAIGRGRLVQLFEILAAGQLGSPVAPRLLWLRWALAPHRRQTWPLVRALAARQQAPASVTPAPAIAVEICRAAADPRLVHLRLLARAARGEAVAMNEVFALTAAWCPHLDRAAVARLQARALELEVRDGAGHAQALRASVLEELALLATEAQGRLPPGNDTLGGQVAALARRRLCEVVESALASLAGDRMTRVHPLEAWERWLALRVLLERVEHQAGDGALSTLWHGGLRNTVWNATCSLYNEHGARAAWVAYAMFAWLADRADCLGDLATSLVNRENARIAQRADVT
jgi:hypothetical protein